MKHAVIGLCLGFAASACDGSGSVVEGSSAGEASATPEPAPAGMADGRGRAPGSVRGIAEVSPEIETAAEGGSMDPSKHPPKGERARGLPIAFGLPRVAAFGAHSSSQLLVETVYQATILSGGAQYGQIARTGTLQVTQFGPQYAPQPSDRLIVHLGGQSHEFVLEDAQGNMQADTALTWLASPHVLRYTHRIAEQAEAKISTRFDGSRFEASIAGWCAVAGTRYEVDLTANGVTGGQRDFDGQDIRTEYDLKGTMRGGGMEVDVNEHHSLAFASAVSLRLLHSQRGSASRFTGTLNNVLRSDGVEYRMQDVQVQTDTKTRGNDSSAALTGMAGAILRNGEPWGRCVLVEGRAFVETPGGVLPLDLETGAGG